MYFKGGKGILNPVDVNGNSIKEGDILTHCYFEPDFPAFFKTHYPKWTEEDIEKVSNKPSVMVKWNKKGFFYAESIDPERYTYMHDFRFKFTKIVNP